uniref:Activating signal cointegrator 1 complex subunit n=1 Tax=Sphaerodactylus townsendi TaxID=933632 RepID=A0ACB8GCE3_9SAUR
MLIQGRWKHESTLLTIPNMEYHHLYLFRKWSHGKRKSSYQGPIECLPELIAACDGKENIFASIVDQDLHAAHIKQEHQLVTTVHICKQHKMNCTITFKKEKPLVQFQAWHFLSHLPVIEVTMIIKGCWNDAVHEQSEVLVPLFAMGTRDDKKWIKLHADQEYVLQINLQRLPFGLTKTKQDSKAVAPRFPKSKDEGWFLIMGEVDKKELIALKRVGYVRNRNTTSVAFYTPEAPGKYIYTLYLMSDSYLGMDQQYDIYLNILPTSTSAQVNTEISDALNNSQIVLK